MGLNSPPQPVRTAFTDEQFAQPYPDGAQHQYWYVARNKIIARRLGALLPPRGQGGQDVVLEIGCGRGIVVDYLRKRGWNVLGCELGRPSPILPEVAPHLTFGTEAFQLPVQLRDAVKCLLLLDLLEHLAEPGAFLDSCRAKFPSCEFVFATLPARMELWSNYDEYYGHFRRYSAGSARALFAAQALQVLDCGYFFHLLYIPALVLRCLRLKRSLVIRAPRRPGWHAALGACFDMEERLLPSCVPGTSLYLAARMRS